MECQNEPSRAAFRLKFKDKKNLVSQRWRIGDSRPEHSPRREGACLPPSDHNPVHQCAGYSLAWIYVLLHEDLLMLVLLVGDFSERVYLCGGAN